MNETTTTNNTENDAERIAYNGYHIEPREVIWSGKHMTRYVILDKDNQTTGNATLTEHDAKLIVDRMIERAKALAEIEALDAKALIRVPEAREFVSNARKLGRMTQDEIDNMLV